ncbi:DUF4012 domain-containing protein [Nocardioides sp. CPCC 205120]|uniref:DUF4012 domain-containing protein n=1 Tax=Nocardioides sp. CPCC 205120 TaxID=3406462 RepID=UPI003B5104F6
MRALRGWKLPVLLVAALLLVLGLYAAWQVLTTSRDLTAAADDAQRLQSAVTAGDDAAADAALADLREHAGSAADRTGGPLWSALTWAPVVGDDLDGVRTVSAVLDDLAADGLEPLVSTARDLETLTPRDGRIDLAAVEGLAAPVAAGNAAFADARERLAEHDPSGYQATVRDKYREVTRQVDRAADALDTADRAVRVLPSMLGAEGPRNYLLVFQNNAEIRAGGGLPGSASLVTADDGAIALTRQVAGSSFGRADEPVLELSEAEEDIWGRQLGTYFLDANFTPDFPRSAALWQARWEQEYEPVDGVLALDPVTLSYVLGATGPVEVPGGPALTQANVVDELLHQVYLRYEDPADQDAYFQAAAGTIFAELTRGGGNPRALIEALGRGTDEGRVKLHSFTETEQASFAGTAIAGELVTDPAADPQVGVYLNDATGAKMSYFLRHEVHVTATSCRYGVQGLTGRAYLLSDAPADAASLPRYVTGAGVYGIEPGKQLVALQIVGPVGGEVEDVTFNDAPLPVPPTVELDGRPVVTVLVELEPGFTADVRWTMTTGEDQPGDVVVDATPGVAPTDLDTVAASAC